MLKSYFGPVVAQLGSSVLLPCSAQIPLSLEELEVEWRRTDSDALVHLFQEGEVRPESQNEGYRDRAFFTEEIAKGNYSLLLFNVTKDDAEMYSCKVYSGTESSENTVQLKVEYLLVTTAMHVVSASVGDKVTMSCFVESSSESIEEVSWKREDRETLVLLFQDGEILADASDERYRGRAEFFTAEISKGNFSLILKDVRTEDKGEYICEAFTGHLENSTTVILQSLGFSSLHIWILVLCFTTLILVVGFSIAALSFTSKEETTQLIHICLALCPNVCMSLAFILWGVNEEIAPNRYTLHEVTCCATVNFLRALLVFKLAPDIAKPIRRLIEKSFEIEYVAITLAVCSVSFSRAIEQKSLHGVRILNLMYGFLVHISVKIVFLDTKDLMSDIMNLAYVFIVNLDAKVLSIGKDQDLFMIYQYQH
ncbi:butyrophilin-like protein 2 [Clupea harengus]|uniref:Butyrophilin-like protein 2 n=1 Tax=Clupea harengus TaxID=7950 RepID=A0A6P8FLQ5_CLUHA|nr:butyrophilin-like protein 2 [Clupea harengus]